MVHVWAARNPPAYSVYLMPKGGLLRAESITNDSTCGFPGGRIVLYDLSGEVVWSYL